jgi:hypothetical protein
MFCSKTLTTWFCTLVVASLLPASASADPLCNDNDGDGWYDDQGDCDDGDASVYPGAPELCDGQDNDCDGSVPADENDGDGDGVAGCDGDCDDDNAAVHPGAAEVCDGLDNDCDGILPAAEIDKDGDGVAECDGDCNDYDDGVHPGAAEICDGVDNDCDGAVPGRRRGLRRSGQRLRRPGRRRRSGRDRPEHLLRRR